MNRRTLAAIGIPLLVYVPGAVHMMLDEWYYACLTPCLIIITAPIERTFALVGSVAGIIGQVILGVVVILWAVTFLGQVLVGRGVSG